jgi:hypothetical protein
MMHSRFKQVLRAGLCRKLVYMDYQRDWIAARKFLRPTDDKLFGIFIEVSLVEWRRIHRVEQLLDSINKNFDSMVRFLIRLQVGDSLKPS